LAIFSGEAPETQPEFPELLLIIGDKSAVFKKCFLFRLKRAFLPVYAHSASTFPWFSLFFCFACKNLHFSVCLYEDYE
jgi:hypothetical protein